MLFLLDCVSIGLPLSHSLGIAAPAHLRLRAAGAAASASERASADSRFVVGLYGAIPGARCGGCVQGWDGMGWEGDARFPNCPKWPNFTAARQRRQCNRDHCHDDRNRSMKSRRVIIVKCILRIVSAVINPPHSLSCNPLLIQ